MNVRSSTPRWRHWSLFAVAVVLAAAILGLVACGLPSDDKAVGVPSGVLAEPSDGRPAGDAGPGPSGRRWGVPFGFSRTGEGAAAAAAGYVTSTATLLTLPPSRVADAVASMSAEASTASRLAVAQSALQDVRDAEANGRGPLQYLQGVLAVRVEDWNPDRAVVWVWWVGVLSADGVVAPRAGWWTSQFELVWENDDWKVLDEGVLPGPTPTASSIDPPATSTELRLRLDGFTPWEAGR